MSLVSRIRALPVSAGRPRRRPVVAIRAAAADNTTSVRFKIHRHVDYGQSLLVVGSIPELGSWDAKNAVDLVWGDGDNWSATLALPQGTSVEYKYITKRKDTLDWCPGQNKAVALPTAAVVEVSDSWDTNQNQVSILTPAAPMSEPEPAPPASVQPPAPAAEAVLSPLPAELQPATSAELSPLTEALAKLPDLEQYSAVSTVENLHVPELEGGGPAASNPACMTKQSLESPAAAAPATVYLANNIVQGAPPGAVAVGQQQQAQYQQDPITEYEEADKVQEVLVGVSDKANAAAVLASARPGVRALDSMTVAELKTECKRRGMSSLGSRRELVVRLQRAGALP